MDPAFWKHAIYVRETVVVLAHRNKTLKTDMIAMVILDNFMTVLMRKERKVMSCSK